VDRIFLSAGLSNGMQTDVKLWAPNYIRVIDFDVDPLCTTFHRCPLCDMLKETDTRTDRHCAENSYRVRTAIELFLKHQQVTYMLACLWHVLEFLACLITVLILQHIPSPV
jgi:hypothetical protein